MRRARRLIRHVAAPHADHRATSEHFARIARLRRPVERTALRRARIEIGRIDQILGRHLHIVRIADIMVAVGIGETLGFHPGHQHVFLGEVSIRWQRAIIQPKDHVLRDRAGTWRRRRTDTDLIMLSADGGTQFHPVISKILHRHGAGQGLCRHGRNDRLGIRACIEAVRAILGERRERRSIFRIVADHADRERLSIRIEIGSAHRVIIQTHRRAQPLIGKQPAKTGRHLEAIRRKLDRRLENACPFGLAEHLMRGRIEAWHRRNTGRAARLRGGDIGQDFAILQEEVFIRCCRRRLAPVKDGQLISLIVVIDHERTAADAGALGLDQTQHSMDSDCRIHRVSTLAQYFQASFHRARVCRGHHGALCPGGAPCRFRRLDRFGFRRRRVSGLIGLGYRWRARCQEERRCAKRNMGQFHSASSASSSSWVSVSMAVFGLSAMKASISSRFALTHLSMAAVSPLSALARHALRSGISVPSPVTVICAKAEEAAAATSASAAAWRIFSFMTSASLMTLADGLLHPTSGCNK